MTIKKTAKPSPTMKTGQLARKGRRTVGRPPKPKGQTKRQRSITLSPQLARTLEKMGGNISQLAEQGLLIVLTVQDPTVAKVVVQCAEVVTGGVGVSWYAIGNDGAQRAAGGPGVDAPELLAELNGGKRK